MGKMKESEMEMRGKNREGKNRGPKNRVKYFENL